MSGQEKLPRETISMNLNITWASSTHILLSQLTRYKVINLSSMHLHFILFSGDLLVWLTLAAILLTS
ncbi:hypothetical protein HOLleu_21904 [Holothuria leucospilota]|uniref:Uncharacterized protein n=1 Tax=Holothuria leucospilota TaxID=206669 RepID=A0A9Q1BY26_HOLLE|nr:hypothetical protein HOLleu_21904 [Holothuria leucospilota]